VADPVIEYFRGTDELEAAAGSVAEAEVVDMPQASIERHPEYEQLVASSYRDP
jgi:hypothetical protein